MYLSTWSYCREFFSAFRQSYSKVSSLRLHSYVGCRMPLFGKSNGGREVKVLEGVTGNVKSDWDDDAWVPSDLVHEPPLLSVTQPKGSFCTIDARFQVALDPDGVYDIITDPNNRRVFKNIKVKFRLTLCP